MSNVITAAEKPERKPDLASVGFTGITRHRGLISEEYVPELSSARAVGVYGKMRADGMIEAITRALKLPIMAASWVVEPGGTDANAKKARDLVENQLFNQLGVCWEETVREALSYLQYGFGVSAKNWIQVKGELVLDDLLPLHPRTIVSGGKNWDLDERGRLLGVWQYGTDGTNWREEYIPRNRFVHFANDSDFRNPEGRSIYRGAYKHWLCKDTLYRIEMIGLERTGVGVPVIKYRPDDWNEELKEKLESFGNGLIAYQNGYLIVPEGTDVENFTLKTSSAEIHAAISHHDTKAAQSVLAQFLQLGTEGKGGAYALSADQSDLFLLCLETGADYLAAKINREVIPEMVSYNIATDQYPKVSATVSRTSAAALANMVRPLSAGLNAPVTWAEADEDWLREALQLPPRSEQRPPRYDPTNKPGKPGPVDDTGKPQQPEEKLSRTRIELPMVLSDPGRFAGEQPTYPEQGEAIDEFLADLRAAGGRLKAAFWKAAALPETTEQAFEKKPAALPELSKAQKRALDRAIAQFLTELAGEDRSEAGFTGTDSEDALLQGHLRLAHAVGVNQAQHLTGAQAAAFAPTRESPQIQALLTDAFSRLSKDGELKIGAKLDALREVLITGALDGRSAFEVARDLEAQFESLGYDFERLARTEAAYASNQGSVDEWRAEGVTLLEPIISGLACSICSAHAGTRVAVAEAVPGDNVAPYHPNCLCSVAPVVE